MKSQAYYEELFENLVQYAEWNPDNMVSEDDLRKQLQNTLGMKYSDNMLNRMKNTERFRQTSLNNFTTQIQQISSQEAVILTPKQKMELKGLSPYQIKDTIKNKYVNPIMQKGFNLKGTSKGIPVLVKKISIKYGNKLVTKYRDSKGRFASYR